MATVDKDFLYLKTVRREDFDYRQQTKLKIGV